MRLGPAFCFLAFVLHSFGLLFLLFIRRNDVHEVLHWVRPGLACLRSRTNLMEVNLKSVQTYAFTPDTATMSALQVAIIVRGVWSNTPRLRRNSHVLEDLPADIGNIKSRVSKPKIFIWVVADL